jgi:hypothetical protein
LLPHRVAKMPGHSGVDPVFGQYGSHNRFSILGSAFLPVPLPS